MKKKLLIIAFGCMLAALPSIVSAASASPSATPTTNLKQVEDLKDRLATKVAQLSQTQRSAIYGTVKSTSISSFTVETKTKDMKIELTDNLKVFQVLKGKRTELTTDDISKNDPVVVFGQYDSTLDLLKASVVFIEGSHETRVSGMLSAVNKDDYSITVTGAGGQQTIVDFEKTTRAFNWVSGKEEKSGFSSLTVNAVVTAVGVKNAKEANRMSASRIIQLLPPGSATESATPTMSASASAQPTAASNAANAAKTTPKP